MVRFFKKEYYNFPIYHEITPISSLLLFKPLSHVAFTINIRIPLGRVNPGREL
jgi:hypothetical protein